MATRFENIVTHLGLLIGILFLFSRLSPASIILGALAIYFYQEKRQ